MSKNKEGSLANILIDDLMNDDELELSDSSSEELDDNLVLSQKDFQLGTEEDEVVAEPVPDDRTVPLQKEEVLPAEEDNVLVMGEPAAPSGGDDKTVPLASSQPMSDQAAHKESSVRVSVGRFNKTTSGQPTNVAEFNLSHSENLKMAQDRIIELEKLVEKLRVENEELVAAGDTLKRKSDSLLAKKEGLEAQLSDQKVYFEDERKIIKESLQVKDREIFDLKQKSEEKDVRLSANMQKIRVRERELENRLELVKMESAAVIRNKNEIILDLKRKVDQLEQEIDNYRSKGLELNKHLDNKEEVLKRTVRTLRIALTMLEGSDESGAPEFKKAK